MSYELLMILCMGNFLREDIFNAIILPIYKYLNNS